METGHSVPVIGWDLIVYLMSLLLRRSTPILFARIFKPASTTNVA
jgi:hypothetical protein